MVVCLCLSSEVVVSMHVCPGSYLNRFIQVDICTTCNEIPCGCFERMEHTWGHGSDLWPPKSFKRIKWREESTFVNCPKCPITLYNDMATAVCTLTLPWSAFENTVVNWRHQDYPQHLLLLSCLTQRRMLTHTTRLSSLKMPTYENGIDHLIYVFTQSTNKCLESIHFIVEN